MENKLHTDDGAFQVSFEIPLILFQVLDIHRHHPVRSCIWSGGREKWQLNWINVHLVMSF